MEKEAVLKKRATLVRRVSSMFTDGTYSGPPLLFGHTSMQKLRLCCQNLNLFPYLLYSFGNSKSHPFAKKVNVCISQLLKTTAERLFIVYSSLLCIVLRVIRSKTPAIKVRTETSNVASTKPKFLVPRKQKPKQISYLLLLVIYLAPLVLAFQLVALCNLLTTGEYQPGFIFLVSALLCLGYISLKVMIHEPVALQAFKKEKTKIQ